MSLHGRKSAFTPSLSSGTAHCTQKPSVGWRWDLSGYSAKQMLILEISSPYL